jgi:hypothetical protein
MSVQIYHIEGYSRVDHFGQEIVRRAGEHHQTVAEARQAVRGVIASLPNLCRDAGAPRIGWSRGDRHGVI